MFRHIGLLCFVLCLLTGCVRQGNDKLNAVEVLQSNTLTLDAPDSTENTVYVSVREHSGKVPGLEAQVENTLKAKGYSITPNPSMAGYILQLNVVYAGSMDPQTARAAVPGGYGHEVTGQGQGAAVIITDIIIAARFMPKTNRRQNHVIANTSVRSKVADEQLRLAAIMPGEKINFAAAAPSLKKAVADTVAAAFSSVR